MRGWTQMARLRSRKLTALLLLAALTFLAVPAEPQPAMAAQGATSSQSGAAPSTDQPPPVPNGFGLVAQRNGVRLYWNAQALQFLVEDGRSGARWYSSPPDAPKEPKTSDQWKRNMGSLFMFTYTDTRFTVSNSSNMIAETSGGKGKATSSVQGEAITVQFDMTALGLSFAMVIKLTDEGLSVTIPDASMKETGKWRLAEIDLLPFFGAQRPATDGYIFLPDGTGALVRFKEGRPEEDPVYSESVYGNDPALMRPSSPRQRVRAPVFGTAVRPGAGAGLFGIVTQGEMAAKINVATHRFAVNYYRTWPTLQYRQVFLAILSKTRSVNRFQADRIPGDRTVQYVLLSGADATYSGMAATYRRYLMDALKVKQLPKGEGPLALLRLVGGSVEQSTFWRPYVAGTTFSQGQEIVSKLLGEGVKDLSVTYELWMKDGDRFAPANDQTPARQLGGADGLKALAGYLKERQVPFYLSHQYTYMQTGFFGFRHRSAMVRGANQQPLLIDRRFRNLTYAINPATALERYVRDDLPRFREYGLHGLMLGHTDTLTSDFNKEARATRSDSLSSLTQQWREVREQVGHLAAQDWMPYTLGLVDLVQDLPVSGSYLLMADEAVPFLQLVAHGLVHYGSDAGNNRDEPVWEFLKAVETGALPTYALTWESADKLQKTAIGGRLTSTHYELWLPALVQEYKRYERELAHTRGLFMTGHRRLADGVTETHYEDGTRVIVNYQDRPYTVEGRTVPALDFLVIKGG